MASMSPSLSSLISSSMDCRSWPPISLCCSSGPPKEACINKHWLAGDSGLHSWRIKNKKNGRREVETVTKFNHIKILYKNYHIHYHSKNIYIWGDACNFFIVKNIFSYPFLIWRGNNDWCTVRNGASMKAVPMCISGDVEDGVSWCSAAGLLSGPRFRSQRSAEETGNLCSPAGVLGGVGMAEMSSRGGTETTTGLEQLVSLFISITWMGAEWLRRFTWYFFWPLWPCVNEKDKDEHLLHINIKKKRFYLTFFPTFTLKLFSIKIKIMYISRLVYHTISGTGTSSCVPDGAMTARRVSPPNASHMSSCVT